jgi:hypothetical protein
LGWKTPGSGPGSEGAAGSGSDWGSFTGWGGCGCMLVVWMIAVWMILAVFPDFCVEEAVEEIVAGDAVEACGGEG